MTSKTSLFNVGIYKSTIKRNIWCSIIFFVLMFLTTSMPLISDINYIKTARIPNEPYIYNSAFFGFTMFLCAFVPTVVAMLVYRFVHSKKAAIFAHSLPVNRNANFISTLMAAFTLMFAPVVLNGIILMLMSVTAYSGYFTIANCLVWMGVHIFFLFVMFSVAIFSVMLTGSTIATPVINFIVHIFLLAIAAEFSYLAYEYIFGYTNEQIILTFIAENHPVTWFVKLADNISYDFAEAKLSIIKEIWIYFVIGLLFYVFSYVLYKKRRIEKTEDVASFKILNPIYKYLITFVATLGAYAVYQGAFAESFVSTVIAVIITSCLVYFGCEMILKKTFAVWKSYKGLVIFAVSFCVMICLFAFTSFFGFETRIPDIDDIDSVSVHHYYYGESKPYVNDPAVIEYANKLHKNIVDNYMIDSKSTSKYYNDIHIEYKLKDGSELAREYSVDDALLWETMCTLYQSDEYVTKNEAVFGIENIKGIRISKIQEYISNKNDISELMDCIKQDMLSLDYGHMYIDTEHYANVLSIEYEIKNNNKYSDDYTRRTEEQVNINANYKNTINWLKQKGYWDKLKLSITEQVYIGKASSVLSAKDVQVEESMYTIKDASSLNKLSEYISNMEITAGDGEYVLYKLHDGDYVEPYTMINNTQLEQIKQLLNLE